MKGFILKITKAKNEDIIVRVLSKDSINSYYRFYGARHSVLQMGYLIDFEIEEDNKGFMPRLRNITHIGFPWIYNREKLMLWHRFIAIFEPHLRDVTAIEPFFYETLLDCAKKWHKQSPKRLALEGYIKILEHEGRLYNPYRCVICNKNIENRVAIKKSFLPAHPECINAKSYNLAEIANLIKTKSSINLSDDSVEALLPIILKGF